MKLTWSPIALCDTILFVDILPMAKYNSTYYDLWRESDHGMSTA